MKQDNESVPDVITKAEKQAVLPSDILIPEKTKTVKDNFQVEKVGQYGSELKNGGHVLRPRCDDDSLLVGGGYYLHSDKGVKVVASDPMDDNSWFVQYVVDTSMAIDVNVEAHALCLKLK